MSTIRVAGDTSGYVDLQAPAVAGAVVCTLPSISGTLVTGQGRVVMQRTGINTWVVLKADGSTLNTSSSTTGGLQEAITEACANGNSLFVTGGSITDAGADVAVINCTTGIVFPPMQGKSITIEWCSINFTSNVSGNGIYIDSCMM